MLSKHFHVLIYICVANSGWFATKWCVSIMWVNIILWLSLCIYCNCTASITSALLEQQRFQSLELKFRQHAGQMITSIYVQPVRLAKWLTCITGYMFTQIHYKWAKVLFTNFQVSPVPLQWPTVSEKEAAVCHFSRIWSSISK